MPKSQPPRRPQPKLTNSRVERVRRGRTLAAIAEFLRNMALVVLGAPLIEPMLVRGSAIDPARAAIGAVVGLALLAISLMLERSRED